MGKIAKVIKLGATWCAPCKAYARTFDKVSKLDEFSNIVFSSFDVENDTEGVELCEKFKIVGVPTTILLDGDGNLIERNVGAINEMKLISFIRDNDGDRI